MVDPIVCTGVCLACTAMAYYVGYVLGVNKAHSKITAMFNILDETGEFPLGDEKLLLVKRERR